MKFLCLLVLFSIVLVNASPRSDIMKAAAAGTKLNTTVIGRTGTGGSMTTSLVSTGIPTVNELLYPYDTTSPRDWNDVYVTTLTGPVFSRLSIESATGCVCGAGQSCVKAVCTTCTTCTACTTLYYCYNPVNGIIANGAYVGTAAKYDTTIIPIEKYIRIDWYPLPSGTSFAWESEYASPYLT